MSTIGASLMDAAMPISTPKRVCCPCAHASSASARNRKMSGIHLSVPVVVRCRREEAGDHAAISIRGQLAAAVCALLSRSAAAVHAMVSQSQSVAAAFAGIHASGCRRNATTGG